MKKSIVILLFFIAFGAKAQGNLQFNQVITKSQILSCGQTSTTLTVPVGKVWKIEYYSYDSFYINNINLSFNSSADDNRPIWLKAGDSIYYKNTFPSTNCIAVNFLLSIIEFNITQ